jgi:hypothetical protein
VPDPGEPVGFDDRYVIPYYLQLMAFNAAVADEVVLREIRIRAGELSVDEIRRLLLDAWRPRVMGAWYAIARPRPELSDAVHASLRTCQGHLSSPPLIVAVLQYAREDTPAALDAYEERDRLHDWGAAGLARAAAEVLGEPPRTTVAVGSPSTEDVETLRSLRRTAQLLGSS